MLLEIYGSIVAPIALYKTNVMTFFSAFSRPVIACNEHKNCSRSKLMSVADTLSSQVSVLDGREADLISGGRGRSKTSGIMRLPEL